MPSRFQLLSTAALFVAVSFLNPAHAQLKVAFIASDGGVESVKNDILAADARFNAAESQVFQHTLPTLSTLLTFDAVLAWTNSSFMVGGDQLLQDYVDNGGGVVLGTFWGQGPYALFTDSPFVTERSAYSASALGSFDASSPLFAGVTTLSASTYRGDFQAVAPGATLVASWQDGAPLVAHNAAKNVVGITLFPNVTGYGHASGDYALLFRNALDFVAQDHGVVPPLAPVPEPSTYGLIGGLLLCGLVVRRRLTAQKTT